MKVRGVRADDVEILLRLRCALWPDIVLDRQQMAIRLRGQSSARYETFLVEDDGGTVCGFLELSWDPGVPGESPRAVVDGVFVVPPARRQGLARQLIQGAERWAHRRGAVTLSCELDPSSADHAQAMSWLGFGSAAHRVRMHRNVSAPLDMERDGAPAPAAASRLSATPEPVLVMEPVRGRGFLYFNLILFAVAVVSFLNTNIYSKDMLPGVLLPLLDAVFVIYFLFLFMMRRYSKRADSNARADQLFRDGP
jgi:aminoglycoside 6'-N-acetyltransferase I